jgi:hypothetical protein
MRISAGKPSGKENGGRIIDTGTSFWFTFRIRTKIMERSVQVFPCTPPPFVNQGHERSGFAIQSVLNIAIFCVEMTPDY